MDFIFLEDPTLNSKLITKDINKMMCRYCVDLLSKNTDIWLVFVEFQVAIKFVDKRSVKDLKEVSQINKLKSDEYIISLIRVLVSLCRPD